MENLIHQVPELKLKKHSEIKTLHRNDMRNSAYVGYQAGDVLTLTWYTDFKGVTWTRTDIMYYIQLQEIIDREKKQVEIPELELS